MTLVSVVRRVVLVAGVLSLLLGAGLAGSVLLDDRPPERTLDVERTTEVSNATTYANLTVEQRRAFDRARTGETVALSREEAAAWQRVDAVQYEGSVYDVDVVHGDPSGFGGLVGSVGALLGLLGAGLLALGYVLAGGGEGA
ncbi:hypothetical protein [Halospeciosus flavus]|uniref:DUF7979 domain-containing protein n=1 Tax=Halospeciosus flavus TaxID=3032283 RepID=A0ABD5Z570_9EURY|nr:hypothetical protein [Halospeciosus flavus]